MRSLVSISSTAILALGATTSAFAGDAPPPGSVMLSGWATADNALDVSVSTSPTDAGTAWFSGASWGTTFSGSLVITQPGTYYIQVRAQDSGRPEMFIGYFTLAGANASFANSTQSLATNTADWVASTSGFGVNTSAPVFYGDNGAGPWGTFAQMGPTADFIWSSEYVNGVAYFTASFTVTPTPGAAAVLGLGGLFASRRRRA